MKNNPFTSKEFTSIWSKYFNNSIPNRTFNFIEGLLFTKNKYLPLYINIGKNLTNGLSYKLKINESDYKNKVFFIYDIPGYLNISNPKLGTLKLKAINQYKGYLANLDDYTNLHDYIGDNFSSKSRGVFKKSAKKLEDSFNIKYKMYYGNNITKDEYDFIFDNFNRLLKKRYNEKQINNHYLSEKKWEYLKELVYPMVISKKATLFVIFDGNTPITISVNYIAENIDFGALTVFDTDYSKFNIGFIDIMKHLEWCIENNIQIFDFSKGDFDYKKRWGNKIYNFEYHLLYDSSSIIATLIAAFLAKYFTFKQILRNNNTHTRFHEMIFFLKKNNKKIYTKEFHVIKEENNTTENNLSLLDFNTNEYAFLKKIVYDFLYRYSESINDVNVYLSSASDSIYFIKGKNNNLKVRHNS